MLRVTTYPASITCITLPSSILIFDGDRRAIVGAGCFERQHLSRLLQVFLTISGERHYLWRAVDQDENIL
jgi:hypothetical protein